MTARVTTKDLDTGEEESIEIREDQYLIVLGPKRYIDVCPLDGHRFDAHLAAPAEPQLQADGVAGSSGLAVTTEEAAIAALRQKAS